MRAAAINIGIAIFLTAFTVAGAHAESGCDPWLAGEPVALSLNDPSLKIHNIHAFSWATDALGKLLGQSKVDPDRAIYSAILAYENAKLKRAELNEKEKSQAIADALKASAHYLKHLGVKFKWIQIDDHQALVIEPGPTKIGRIAAAAKSKFNTGLYLDTHFMFNQGIAAHVVGGLVEALMLTPAALIEQYEHALIHELAHAATDAHARDGVASDFFGELFSIAGDLPFSQPGSVYSRYFQFDEMRSYWIDKIFLLAYFKKVLREGDEHKIRVAKMVLTNEFNGSEKAIAQVRDSAAGLLAFVENHPESVVFSRRNGHPFAEITVKEGAFHYRATFPLIRRHGQAPLSDMEFLLEYLGRSHRRAIQILEKVAQMRLEAGV